MERECGTPVFDNIDDVLAERIVDHSRTHSDRTGSASHHAHPSYAPESRSNSTPPDESRLPIKLMIIGVIVMTLLVLLYRPVHRHTKR